MSARKKYFLISVITSLVAFGVFFGRQNWPIAYAAVPNAPTSGYAYPSSNTLIAFVWTDNSTNEQGFRVESKCVTCGSFTLLGSVGANVTYITTSAYSDGDGATFRVYAYNAEGNSGYSNESTAYAQLNTPTNLNAVVQSPTQIGLSWTNNSTRNTGYTIERKEGTGNWGVLTNITTAIPTTYADKNLPLSRTYTYRVKDVNTNTGAFSVLSNEASASTPNRLVQPNPGISGFMSDVGSVYAVAMNGQKAFVASDPFGVVSVNVADPANMKILGSQRPPHKAHNIAINSTATLAIAGVTDENNAKLTDIVDLTDAAKPKVLASLPLEGGRAVFSPDSKYAYMTSLGDVIVLDTSNPAATRSIATLNVASDAVGVAAMGNYVYIAENFTNQFNGLEVADATNPLAPKIVGTLSLSGQADSIAMANIGVKNYALLSNCQTGDLHIIDVTTPSNLQLIKTVDVFYPTCAAIAVGGNYAYMGGGVDGFKVVNLTVPSNAAVVGAYGIRVSSLAVAGSYAYLALGSIGLTTLDVSNPSSPQYKGNITNKLTGSKTAISGDIAVVVGSPRGTDLISIADPDKPVVISSIAGSSLDVVISTDGRYAYITSDGDLKIVDISTHNVLGATTKPSIAIAFGVSISGDYAYVSDAQNGLKVVNIATPSNPTVVGSVALGGMAGKSAFKMSGASKYVFVANSTLGIIQVVDVTIPTAPILKTSINAGSALGIAVQGNYAYVAMGGSGLKVVDITNPTSPISKGTFVETANAVAMLDNETAIIAQGMSGLTAVDVSNPSTPIKAGLAAKSIGGVQSVTCAQGKIFIADTMAELVIMNPYKDELKITKTTPSYLVNHGEQVIYTIEATNTSPNILNAVTITDPIPNGTTYVTGSANLGGNFNNGVISWYFASIDPNTTKTLTFKVRVY